MTTAAQVIKKAASAATPTQKERESLAGLASSLLSLTEKAAAKYPEARGALLGGSFAKGTWLPGDADLDIFVKIDRSTPKSRFEEIGLAIGREATRGHPRGKKYAQHPYTEANVTGTRVNIVPCFDVKEGEWVSAADRSPFHTRLVEGLPERAKEQVRVLKLFFKGVGVYGAEIRTRGLSGYVAEVLVIRFGSAEGVLRWFSRLKIPAEGRAFSLPDPVDENRDLGTAVSGEKLGLTILGSREFLRAPDIAFFRHMSPRARPKVKERVAALVFSHHPLSEDILWGELRKANKALVRRLEEGGFKVARSISASNNRDRSAFLFVPEFSSLPDVEQRIGPWVDREKDVDAFVLANSRKAMMFWVDEDARVRLLRPREETDLDTFLLRLAREGHVDGSNEVTLGLARTAVLIGGKRLERKAASWKWLKDGIEEVVSDAIGTRRA